VTRDDFSRCLGLVNLYWPHGVTSWTAEALNAWESLLIDLDAVQVAAAIQAIAGDGDRWPPPPGLIRKRTLDLIGGLPNADQAWHEVTVQIARVGSCRGMLDYATNTRRGPVWSHPLVGQVVDALGWDNLCQSETVMADRAHFLRMWDQASERQRTLEQLPPAARAALAGRGLALPNLSADRQEITP
jgi:hypothetical protein